MRKSALRRGSLAPFHHTRSPEDGLPRALQHPPDGAAYMRRREQEQGLGAESLPVSAGCPAPRLAVIHRESGSVA